MTDWATERQAYLARVRRALARCKGCVVSHMSAAIVLGCPVLAVPKQVWLTREEGPRRNGRTHISVARLLPGDVCEREGMPVTAGARTVVDVARVEPFLSALITADGALRQLITRAALEVQLAAMWDWPGIVAARRVVRHAEGRAESPTESVVRGRFIELGLPVPEPQVLIQGGNSFFARVDLALEELGVVAEADGRVKYTDPDVLWQEKLRQEGIEETGRVVLRFTWAQAWAPDELFRARVLGAIARAESLRSNRARQRS